MISEFLAEFDDFIPTFEFTLKDVLKSSEDGDLLICKCLAVLHQVLQIEQCSLSVYGRLSLVLVNQLCDASPSASEVTCARILRSILLWAKTLIDKCQSMLEDNPFDSKLQTSFKQFSSQLKQKFSQIKLKNFPESLLPTLVSTYLSCEFCSGNDEILCLNSWLDEVFARCSNQWTAYKIVRNLLACGQFSPTETVVKSLIENCQNVKFLSWLKVLLLIVLSEKCLSEREHSRNFGQMLCDYDSAVRLLSSYTSTMVNEQFQRTFVQLRFEFLDLCKQITEWIFWAQNMGGAEFGEDSK